MSASPIKYQTKEIAAAALVLSMLTGCTVGPRYRLPAPPVATTYTPEPQPSSTTSTAGAGGTEQHFNSTADIPAQWWTLFQSPPLDRMVREALDHSPTLTEAVAKLKKAQEEANARTG